MTGKSRPFGERMGDPMIRNLLQWVLVPGLIFTTGAVLAPASGSSASSHPAAAAAPGWRIFQTFSAGSLLQGVASTGTSNAWATGANSSSVLVLHWNGRSWREITPPPAYRNSEHLPSGIAVATTSGSNAWIFGQFGDSLRSFGLHWTGRGWGASVTFPSSVLIGAAVAPSANDVWAFGLTVSALSGYAAHYNGRGWSRVSFPIAGGAGASALSATNIWAIGRRANSQMTSGNDVAVAHWNGRTWQKVALSPSVPRGTLLSPVGIAALAPRDVWVDAWDNQTGKVVLLHWNGSSWRQVTFPYQNGSQWVIGSDGHGGIWLVAYTDNTGTTGMAHYSDGRWSRQSLPGRGEFYAVHQVTSIPGTTSLWGAGEATSGGKTRGVILKYGD
jgi:hypothetical protein